MRRKRHRDGDRFAKGSLVVICLFIGALAARRKHPPASSQASENALGAPASPMSGGAAKSLERNYHNALMLRDIHSLKLTQTRRWAENLRFILIALSVSATCLSFIGASTIAKDLGVGTGPVEFTIDIILLLLLLVIVAELAWRRGDRANEHQRAIVVLTGFIRSLEDRLRQPVDPADTDLVHLFAERYALIIEILPAHTDADYLNAKRATAKKQASKLQIVREADPALHEAEKKATGTTA